MTKLLLCLLTIAVLTSVTEATTCEMTDDTCEFWLHVDFRMSMVKGNVAVYSKNGKLYPYTVTDTTNVTPEDLTDVITVDGWEGYRLVIAVNGTLPGPSIEVYEGQNVIVHVKNNLDAEAVTVHWHGLHQKNTAYMDGVAYVTQCPILPGETFSYRFKAEPKGTFWYHSHIGSQRSMGLYGGLVVREKKPLKMQEHIAIISDWNHWTSTEVHQRMIYGLYDNRVKYNSTDSLDGAHFSLFRYQSGLINGKGRFYEGDTHNEAPLEIFVVKSGNQVRFRWVAAGSLFPFRISIDEHNMTVISSDGYDLQEVTAESFIINPGERFDFYITADRPVGSYWIRAVTLEIEVNHTAEAILRYEGAPDVEPTSNQKTCTASDTCVVINCPFTYYPQTDYTTCITFDQLKALVTDDPAPYAPADELEERFINFAFPGTSTFPGSANGKAFRSPPVSALTQPQELGKYTCGPECTDQTNCHCFGTIDLEHNKVYQIVFTNMGNGKGWSHPIHMHGHSFYVLKMGYGQYNSETGALNDDNYDVDCRGGTNRNDSLCNDATWTNPSWMGGNVPGLELKNPPRKDTIIVPTGGYVVVRIRADNPGVWFMHCHIELHSSDGMAIVINESFPHHPQAPPNFPRCGDFSYTEMSTGPMPITTMPSNGEYEKNEKSEETGKMVSHEQFWIVTGILIGVVVGLMLIIMFMVYNKEKRQKHYESNQDAGHDNKVFTAM